MDDELERLRDERQHVLDAIWRRPEAGTHEDPVFWTDPVSLRLVDELERLNGLIYDLRVRLTQRVQ